MRKVIMPAVRHAGKVDLRRIGDAASNELLHEPAQEAHIVDARDAASLAAIIPNPADAVRKDGGKAVRRSSLRKTRAAHGRLGTNGGAVQYNDGRRRNRPGRDDDGGARAILGLNAHVTGPHGRACQGRGEGQGAHADPKHSSPSHPQLTPRNSPRIA
jgi:hypothetical protein